MYDENGTGRVKRAHIIYILPVYVSNQQIIINLYLFPLPTALKRVNRMFAIFYFLVVN